MPVKTIAMNKLIPYKHTFYQDQGWDGVNHRERDFYPAELVESIIEDLSNQVLNERKSFNDAFSLWLNRRKVLQHEIKGLKLKIKSYEDKH